MVLELADIVIRPGEQAAFDAAISHGLASVISRCPGFQSATVHKGIESPERYLLQIKWDSIESHTVAFRGSAAFAEWRAIVGPFFAVQPRVEHFTAIAKE